MPTEKEALGAVIERLRNKKLRALRLASDIEDRIKVLQETQEKWLGDIDSLGEPESAIPAVPHGGGVPSGWIRQGIDRFIMETGKGAEGFAPAEVVAYLRNAGHKGAHLYSTTYESLKRMSLRGQLERRDGKFYTVSKPEETRV